MLMLPVMIPVKHTKSVMAASDMKKDIVNA